jgi:hypothetical protein
MKIRSRSKRDKFVVPILLHVYRGTTTPQSFRKRNEKEGEEDGGKPTKRNTTHKIEMQKNGQQHTKQIETKQMKQAC